jgi:hypothetical protein
MWWAIVAIAVGGAAGGFMLGWYLATRTNPNAIEEFIVYGDFEAIATKVALALGELDPRNLRSEIVPDYSVTIRGKPVNVLRFKFFLDSCKDYSCEDLIQVRPDISYPITNKVEIAVAGKDKGKIVKHLRMRLRLGQV